MIDKYKKIVEISENLDKELNNLCKYSKTCEYYDKNSKVCNEEENKTYCGKFRGREK